MMLNLKRFQDFRTLDSWRNEAVQLGSRFIPSPSSCHSTLESLYAVIWPIVPVIWGDQGWAGPLFAFEAPPPSTQARWATSTCREAERTLAVIFCRTRMQQRDVPVSGESSDWRTSFRPWLKFLMLKVSDMLRRWQLNNLVPLRSLKRRPPSWTSTS